MVNSKNKKGKKPQKAPATQKTPLTEEKPDVSEPQKTSKVPEKTPQVQETGSDSIQVTLAVIQLFLEKRHFDPDAGSFRKPQIAAREWATYMKRRINAAKDVPETCKIDYLVSNLKGNAEINVLDEKFSSVDDFFLWFSWHYKDNMDLTCSIYEEAMYLKQSGLIKEYQAAWDKLLTHNEKCLLPLVEKDLVKIFLSGLQNKDLHAYLYESWDTTPGSLEKIRVNASRLIEKGVFTEFVSSEKDSQKWNPKNVDFNSRTLKPSASPQDYEENPYRDVKSLGVWCELNPPKKRDDIVNLLGYDMLFPESMKPYLSCSNIFVAFMYLIWDSRQKKVFDDFFNHSVNSKIIEKWIKESERSAYEPKSLSFPTSFPNQPPEDILKSLVTFYQTERFIANMWALNSVFGLIEEYDM